MPATKKKPAAKKAAPKKAEPKKPVVKEPTESKRQSPDQVAEEKRQAELAAERKVHNERTGDVAKGTWG